MHSWWISISKLSSLKLDLSTASQISHVICLLVVLIIYHYIDYGRLCGHITVETNSIVWPIIFTNANIVLPNILTDNI